MKPKVTPQTSAAHLKKISPMRPTLAIVLGSGFHHALNEVRGGKISYTKIPGFPKPTVAGHAGELYFGHLGRTPVLVLSGRAHFYEGHEMERVTFATRTLAAFGIKDLLLTNAAGGINKNFRPGDFMVLTDHINFMGTNPLRGAHIPGLPRFVDLTETYDKKLRELLFRAGKISKLKLQRGVYLAVSGPAYETPAKVRLWDTRRGRGGHEHRAGGGRGAAMRPEGGGNLLHHQPRGGHQPGKIVAREGAGNRRPGKGFGSTIA
jgi:purine-nucleoside phosphorylase